MLAGGGRPVVPIDHTVLAEAIARALAGTISASEMDRLIFECGLVASGNNPRPFNTGWWPNLSARAKAWGEKTLDDYIAAGRRPMLVFYGA
jgi:hypothetical protein